MPYLPKARRFQLELGEDRPRTAGDLNYVLCCAVLAFLGERPDYSDYNAAVGALECAKQELIRMSLAPYEDAKAEQNGTLPWPTPRSQ